MGTKVVFFFPPKRILPFGRIVEDIFFFWLIEPRIFLNSRIFIHRRRLEFSKFIDFENNKIFHHVSILYSHAIAELIQLWISFRCIYVNIKFSHLENGTSQKSTLRYSLERFFSDYVTNCLLQEWLAVWVKLEWAHTTGLQRLTARCQRPAWPRPRPRLHNNPRRRCRPAWRHLLRWVDASRKQTNRAMEPVYPVSDISLSFALEIWIEGIVAEERSIVPILDFNDSR